MSALIKPARLKQRHRKRKQHLGQLKKKTPSFSIGIGGTQSGAGKTTLAVSLLNYFKRHVPTHSLVMPRTWGAIKFTRTASTASVITDRELLATEGKDTEKLLSTGAEVVWVRASQTGIQQALLEAAKRLSHLDGIIIEGNSAIEFLRPDIVIFIVGSDKKHWKKNIGNLLETADIIICDNDALLPETVKQQKIFPRTLPGKQAPGEFFKAIIDSIYEKRAQRRTH